MEIGQLFTSAFLITWLAASMRLAGPVLLASLGEIFDELSGVLNIGIEGTILLGAVTSLLVSMLSGNAWLGLLAAILVGLLVNLPLAWMYIDVKASQVVVGIVSNTLALGLASYAYRVIVGETARPMKAPMLPVVNLPWLSDLSFLGPVVFNHRSLIAASLSPNAFNARARQ